MPGLYWNTVNGLLKEVLIEVMQHPEFDPFRIVGGTSLSLQLGHRISVDIDLFTDATYGTIDFQVIDKFLKKRYDYVMTSGGLPGMDTSYFVGSSADDAIKIDLYYTDTFIQPSILQDSIRLASVEEIIAMKLDVVLRGGRKKDFWDLHALLDEYSLKDMLRLHQSRYSFAHDEEKIRQNMTDFRAADDDFQPICLQGKYWELIKYDIIRWINA